MSVPTAIPAGVAQVVELDLRFEVDASDKAAGWAQLRAFVNDARQVAEQHPGVTVRYVNWRGRHPKPQEQPS